MKKKEKKEVHPFHAFWGNAISELDSTVTTLGLLCCKIYH